MVFVRVHERTVDTLLYLLHSKTAFGFNTPPMDNLEMRGSVPNIIALPFGKSPPMYIRAPSWRQLLKLMAKLSATRVEASVEALAVTKGELQLRTVIQFFKVRDYTCPVRVVLIPG